MTATTVPRTTPFKEYLSKYRLPLAADAVIVEGTMVAINSSGYAVPVTASSTLRVIGMAMEAADNTGGDAGDVSVDVKAGKIFGWANSSGGDEITFVHIGNTCYAQDNQTVARTSNTGARPVAGRIVDVEPGIVWVDHTPFGVTDGDLVAANNLSDVADEAAARANIGANRMVVRMRADDLIGANAGTYYYVHSGPDAVIEGISSRLSAALATGNATITAAISTDGDNFVAVVDGVLTIAQAGSSAGDLDSAAPSDDRTLTDGDVLRLTVGGTNTGAAAADIGIGLSY